MIRSGIIFGIFAAAIGASTATGSSADTVTIEIADGFEIVRCYNVTDMAICEFVTNAESDMLRCIALDDETSPLAVSQTFTFADSIMFQDLDAAAIAEVACEEI